jgi:hypothetical protein
LGSCPDPGASLLARSSGLEAAHPGSERGAGISRAGRSACLGFTTHSSSVRFSNVVGTLRVPFFNHGTRSVPTTIGSGHRNGSSSRTGQRFPAAAVARDVEGGWYQAHMRPVMLPGRLGEGQPSVSWAPAHRVTRRRRPTTQSGTSVNKGFRFLVVTPTSRKTRLRLFI